MGASGTPLASALVVIDRVTNLMSSRTSLSLLGRTSASLFQVQQQISTGRSILRASDDVVKSATIGVLDDRLQRSEQVSRNLQHAGSALAESDSTLNEASTIGLQAKSIASAQVSATTSTSERRSQAQVVDGLISGLFNVANRKGVAGYVLGAGQSTSSAPVSALYGGYRYSPRGTGLTTDLGAAESVPLTLGADNPIAGISSRVRGASDLNPSLTAQTRLADLDGARGLGITLGTVRMSIDGSDPVEISLTGSDTAEDVRARLERAIRTYETDEGVTVLGPGGVSFNGGGFSMDLAGTGATPQVEFFDIGTAVTAKDLGLTGATATQFTPATPDGGDVAPELTWRSTIASMTGLTAPLGTLRISNMGRSVDVDLSGASTLQDVRNSLEGTGLGIRVEINEAGTGIDVFNELAGISEQSLSIGEVAGGDAATQLGIRTLSATTRLSDFNFGGGVSIVNGSVDPVTGAADPTRDVDFEIVLGDTAATRILVDLRPQDVVSVQTLLDRINSVAATQLAAAGLPSDGLVAGLAGDGNGLALQQSSTFGSALRVETRNNSLAAQQLGLTGGSYNASSATLIGTDRAKVRVDCLFTHLLDLREGLIGNSVSGIQLASAGVESSLERLAEFRGVVGGNGQRVDAATDRETDRSQLDETIRSQLRDVDFTEAATRFSLLQTQLEAGLRTTAMASQRSLLDFLG